ncbi:NADP-dependent oxidoreductase [Pseudenhygromyxa sp. WMMC2535]|uniref:NADP-dependent oxidoreductase n=1 Tax=Pseudenhygromyxa sp. WMMC2535 TaxID=2712867 RepID=UPI0015564777|nr:NADP-dependent oxidoreductase [Pseudenhygromyxa sp. WMMC2535]NVB39927.1 NADP-dependent oxidoreductase [Pseudenhygromyxa sp. WMMC2535]
MPTSRQFLLSSRPEGELSDDDLELREVELPELGEGEIRARTTWMSVDPTIRIWMSDIPQYMPPIAIGEVVRSIGVAEVEASTHPGFAVGDQVSTMIGWQTRIQGKPEALGCMKLPEGTDPGMFLATVGPTSGMTAYFGLFDIGEPKPGETVVVDAAAGAVGSLVGQLAKLHGCRAVGIAGGPEKCAYVTEELGFDACIDYKNEDVGAGLDRACPDGIDVCFENVGGPIFDEILLRMNNFGRVSLCGMVSGYNRAGEQLPGPYQFPMVLMRRLKVQGFIILDYADRYAEAAAKLGAWVAQGKLESRLHVREGFESLPDALRELVGGKSAKIGKMVVRF